MKDIRYNLRLIIAVVLAYMLNKFVFRPYVLQNDLHEFWNILVLSFPNLCEGIAGTLVLINIALVINTRKAFLKTGNLYHIIPIIAAIYVILQELKIHNLGGRNVYDPYDLLFSIIGLVLTYAFLLIKRPIISAFNPIDKVKQDRLG